MSWVVTIGSGMIEDSNGICNLAGNTEMRRVLLQVHNTENGPLGCKGSFQKAADTVEL